MPRGDHDFAKGESIAIFYFLRGKTVFCAAFSAGVNLRRFESRAELARATHEVGMNMRFKNVRDGHACFARRLDVNIAVRAWIKYRRNSFIIIAYKIRKFCDAFRLDGFKNE
jgi:hypothetical protein